MNDPDREQDAQQGAQGKAEQGRGERHPGMIDEAALGGDGAAEDGVVQLDHDLGYAGFRIHYPLNNPEYKDELAVFLGASYFRLLARDQVYGLLARGLDVDTDLPKGEECPA